jgi:hypothetical protein
VRPFPPNTRLRLDVRQSIRHVEELARSDILTRRIQDDILFWAVVTRMIILTRDLVAKSEAQAKKPITFKDDVIVVGDVKDVASLITFFRDALCHIESNRHMARHDIYATLNMGPWKGSFATIGDFELINDYDDDIALFIGSQRLYVHRHLLRAFREAKNNLEGFLDTLDEYPP